jgi:putative ABC transport system permease protein
MGIRIALGADRRRIVRFVLTRALRLAVVGAGVGLAVAVAASQAARSMLYGVDAGDPVTYAIVGSIVLIVATLAGALPARRAARISPLVAMKE